ncbi:MAG: GAF domain-containing protein [Candidatus Rokubacteria bacterium]|nr:GAF domain-containing protein [Candidatus Rokubacteria bacterium]
MATANPFAFETRFPINPDDGDFPFRRELSLAPLVAAWQEPGARAGGVAVALGRVVQDAIRQAPELLRPIEDLAVVDRHRELVDVLMAKVFPAASWEQDYAAALLPCQLRVFYATPAFARLFLTDGRALHGRTNLDEHTMATGRLLKAYGLVLRKFYGIDLQLDYPIILTTADPESGLERHFSLQFDPRFMEVAAEAPPALSEPDRRRLLANLGNPELLLELLPPDRFVFRGFAVLKAVEVTDQEVLSGLERDLIERESIVSDVRFQGLQAKLRTFLRRPDLRLGLAAIQGEQVYRLNYGCRLEHHCLFADSMHVSVRDYAGSVYERAARSGHPVIVEDLAAYPERSAIEDAILAMGIRSVVAAPLYYQEQLIGMLDLGSPLPGDLGLMSALKLREVLPLFSMAVRRSLDELESRIQAIIKEKCTAIHPAVEWRFRQAALQTIGRRPESGAVEMEPIVFRDVYPLYAVSDIRDSSTQRSLAIQADLLAHLRLAREVVDAARAAKGLPILGQLGYRIDRQIGQLEAGLGSAAETKAIAFLRQEIESRFEHLDGFGSAVRERIQAYRAALDPRLGTVYRRRKEYEESVTLINETISAYLDAEQELAQGMFPHYFEKQQTDGVDYGIYVGASLVENGVFDELYLENLRLWQLMVTCGVARRADELRGRLPIPLELAHLVLVQHAPLAIRFRFDEKRFDVDGAYNIRYEVIKKRIDKAVIRGTSERITQPGRIAIVYGQRAEAAEYREYLDYLRASGYLTGEIEELELDELQGVQGLRALRVAVDLTGTGPEPRAALGEAVAGVRALRG